jgi:glycosyltransferase involved in cell wall biosynthesis
MMRIGLLVDSLIGGGAERVVLNLAVQFRGRGHEVHILSVRDEVEFELDRDLYRVHALSEDGRLARLRPLNKWLLARRLSAKIREISADGRAFDFFLSNGEDCNRLARMAGLPRLYIVCHNSVLHTLEHKVRHRSAWKRALRRWRWTRRMRAAYQGQNLITVSQAIGEEITRALGIVPRSLATIYNPFDFEAIRAAARVPAQLPASPYVVCVARFQNRKRQDVLLRAFAGLDPALRLVLIGGTYTDSDRRWLAGIEALAAQLGLRERVILPGFQTNPYPWIRAARLSVLCSDSEGLGNVLVESLLLGVPAVATDCPHGPGEILRGPLARFLSPPGNAEALARNMRDALQDYPGVSDQALARFRTGADQYLAHCAAR